MNILDYFIEAWNNSPECMPFCAPRVQNVTANSLGLLKQYEDQLGHDKYRYCVAPDWNTFPGLDPLVASVMEWGHSMDDEQWGSYPSARFEYKVHVSEWLLNSTNAAYLLGDRDTDSHTPLMIDVHANQYDRARARTLNRNPETVKEAADRRKERQKMNKARGSGTAPKGTSSPQGEEVPGATSSGSQRPPEPAQAPRGSQRPPEPAQPPAGGKAKGDGKGGKSSKGKTKDESSGKSSGKSSDKSTGKSKGKGKNKGKSKN